MVAELTTTNVKATADTRSQFQLFTPLNITEWAGVYSQSATIWHFD